MSNKTRFMSVMFSASDNGDEELLNQVAGDIQAAKENGSFEDENGEMSYQDLGDDGVLAIDNENGEQTLIHNEMIQNGDDVYIEMEKIPDYCVEDQSHPEVIEEQGSFVCNPMAEKEFSVTSTNTAVLKIFSDQELVETVSDTVSRTEQDAVVGDLKFEKDSDTDGVIVTDMSSGDQAKVDLEGENMKVTELDQKNFKTYSNKGNMNIIGRRKVFSNAEQYEPIFVVAIDPINKVLVNSPVYSEAAANDLANKLAERGLVGINIFADPDEGRDYALQLLSGEGAETVGEEEEMEVAYSDDTVIANRYFSDRTRFMNRLFAEVEENVSDHMDAVESAIAEGEQVETEDFVITPVDDTTAVVEDKDNGEYTVAEIDGEDMNVDQISADQAADMMADVDVDDDEPADLEQHEECGKAFSDGRIVKVQKQYNIVSGLAKKIKDTGKAITKSVGNKTSKAIAEAKEAGKGADEIAGIIDKNKNSLTAKAGKFLAKNSDAVAKGALATAGVGAAGAAGVGAYKLAKKQKDNSDGATPEALAQIEDQSVEAIQNVQEAAETAIDAINQAKATPVEDITNVKEATYSEKDYDNFAEETKMFSNPSLSELDW